MCGYDILRNDRDKKQICKHRVEKSSIKYLEYQIFIFQLNSTIQNPCMTLSSRQIQQIYYIIIMKYVTRSSRLLKTGQESKKKALT